MDAASLTASSVESYAGPLTPLASSEWSGASQGHPAMTRCRTVSGLSGPLNACSLALDQCQVPLTILVTILLRADRARQSPCTTVQHHGTSSSTTLHRRRVRTLLAATARTQTCLAIACAVNKDLLHQTAANWNSCSQRKASSGLSALRQPKGELIFSYLQAALSLPGAMCRRGKPGIRRRGKPGIRRRAEAYALELLLVVLRPVACSLTVRPASVWRCAVEVWWHG